MVFFQISKTFDGIVLLVMGHVRIWGLNCWVRSGLMFCPCPNDILMLGLLSEKLSSLGFLVLFQWLGLVR